MRLRRLLRLRGRGGRELLTARRGAPCCVRGMTVPILNASGCLDAQRGGTTWFPHEPPPPRRATTDGGWAHAGQSPARPQTTRLLDRQPLRCLSPSSTPLVCLDALTAPEVARTPRWVRDEDDHAAAARGQCTAATRRDGVRPAQLDRPAGPRRRRIRGRAPAAARAARSAVVGVGGRLLGGRLRSRVRAARRAPGGRHDRAEPLVPERRRGAREPGRARRGGARRDGKAALREAVAGSVGRGRVGAGGRRRRSGRALVGEHDPRPGARPAHARAQAGASARRLLGPGAQADRLACVYACATAVEVPVVGMGGVRTDSTRSSSSRSARPRWHSARCSSATWVRRRGFASSSCRRLSPVASATLPQPPHVCCQCGKIPAYGRKQFRLHRAGGLLDSCAHGHVEDAGPGAAPIARSADGGAEAGKRHSRPAGPAQEGPEGRTRGDRVRPPRPARVRLDGEGLRHAHGGPQVRPRQGRSTAESVPHQPVEDRRRAVRAAAERARPLFNR